jgi:hypothetical protein
MRIQFATLTLVVLVFTAFTGNAAPTRNNDDSCDIALLPAATLLLPYFEVSIDAKSNTLMTITNVSPQEQIARVTLWTDYTFPVLSFNVYLTGYDVQSISLYDVIWRGVIGSEDGTGTETSHSGRFSADNPRLDLSNCAALSGTVPAALAARMQSALTTGRVPALDGVAACNRVGGPHTSAVGYATIDVVRRCDTGSPATTGYFADDILWDNVLAGDYQQFDTRYATSEGNPMVHIRAVSEGGTAIERRSYPGQYEVTFRRTFYSRYQNGRTFDARQPLPSVFAARWISGSAAGYRTTFKIWREGLPGKGVVPCSQWAAQATEFAEMVVFDEEENPTAVAPSPPVNEPIGPDFILPATSSSDVTDSTVFPRPNTGAEAGWVYMNLDNDLGDDMASQSWVITTLRAEGQFSVDETAFALGNGCSPELDLSEVNGSFTPIGPAPNSNPEP